MYNTHEKQYIYIYINKIRVTEGKNNNDINNHHNTSIIGITSMECVQKYLSYIFMSPEILKNQLTVLETKQHMISDTIAFIPVYLSISRLVLSDMLKTSGIFLPQCALCNVLD